MSSSTSRRSAEEIAGTLALRGFEVASIEPLDGGDAVIDFEVTANRPDCLSVLGLAREVATAYDLPLDAAVGRPDGAGPAGHDAARRRPIGYGHRSRTPSCARDTPRRSRTSRSAPSPAWMAARLQAAGVRPISTIVDITNYVQPRARPADARVRPRAARRAPRSACAARSRARRSRRSTASSGRSIADMLVIADRDRAQAVAGVMGGAASEVSAPTKTVVVRERVLQAGVGAADEQAARA